MPVCDYRFGVYKRDEGSLFQLAFCYPYLEYYTNGGWCLDPPEYTFENRNPELADYHVTVEAPESFLVAGPGIVKREGTSNMEYSGIADVSGQSMFTEDLSAYSSAYKYTIHEITHQWFYYAVGNNENRESWIDEGITTFLTSEIMCNDTESYHLLKEYYLELLTKYNDSEEIRKLIEFYFPGDIVNDLFAS